MAIPLFEMGKRQEDAKFGMLGQQAGGGAGVDPNLLRLLAQRRQEQGLLGGGMTERGQRPPEQTQGFKVQSSPIDPRMRAALLLRRKLRQQQEQAQAPSTVGGRG